MTTINQHHLINQGQATAAQIFLSPAWFVPIFLCSAFRVRGSDGLGLRISLARTLSGDFLLGVLA